MSDQIPVPDALRAALEKIRELAQMGGRDHLEEIVRLATEILEQKP